MAKKHCTCFFPTSTNALVSKRFINYHHGRMWALMSLFTTVSTVLMLATRNAPLMDAGWHKQTSKLHI